jgi:AraC-like DNA-binding protein
MSINVYPAPEVLKDYVEYFWSANRVGEDAAELEITSFVNGASGILFQHHNGNSVFASSAAFAGQESQTETLPRAYAYGQLTQPNLILAKGSYSVTGVIVKPHAWHVLFGLSATELTERRIELNEFSTVNLTERLLNENRQQARIALLSDFLISRLEHIKTADVLVQESLRRIHRNIRSVKVMHVLKHLQISERQFERRFRQAIGLSPYFYIRVIRFQEALKLMQSKQFRRLSEIAFFLNFADQSHFIKDIKEFSGITPKRLAQKVGDFIHQDIGYFR